MNAPDLIREAIFVGTDAKQAWPISVYDAMNGSCLWSYKGTEMSSESSSHAVIVLGEFLYIAMAEKPVAIHLSLQASRRVHFRSFIPSPVQQLAVSRNGKICCGASNEKIFTWLISSGELASIATGHYQAITRLEFTNDSSHLVTAGKDGRILIWNLTNLLISDGKVEPTQILPAHSLSISDMKLGNGGVGCRIYTVSSDQSAKVHNLLTGVQLLTLVFDRALTACAVDNAELRFFVGDVAGSILQVNLFEESVVNGKHLQTLVENTGTPLFVGHKSKITQLCVNTDGTTLASGCDDQTVRIWHIDSRQCLRTISCIGKPNSLKFYANLPLFSNAKVTTAVRPLQKTVRKHHTEAVVQMKDKINPCRNLVCPDGAETRRMLQKLQEEENISRLMLQLSADEGFGSDLERVKRLNQNLYEFAVEKILK